MIERTIEHGIVERWEFLPVRNCGLDEDGEPVFMFNVYAARWDLNGRTVPIFLTKEEFDAGGLDRRRTAAVARLLARP